MGKYRTISSDYRVLKLGADGDIKERVYANDPLCMRIPGTKKKERAIVSYIATALRRIQGREVVFDEVKVTPFVIDGETHLRAGIYFNFADDDTPRFVSKEFIVWTEEEAAARYGSDDVDDYPFHIDRMGNAFDFGENEPYFEYEGVRYIIKQDNVEYKDKEERK